MDESHSSIGSDSVQAFVRGHPVVFGMPGHPRARPDSDVLLRRRVGASSGGRGSLPRSAGWDRRVDELRGLRSDGEHQPGLSLPGPLTPDPAGGYLLALDQSGESPGATASRASAPPTERNHCHEADLSAESDPPSAQPRISGPHEDAGGSGDPEAAPREGPQEARGHHTLEVRVTGGSCRSARRTGRFTRADRLLKSREFKHVTRRGQRAAAGPYVVLVAANGVAERPRLGLTVSRKVGNAVVRNRVKRRVREWFRREREQLEAGTEVVVIARRDAAAVSFEQGGEILSALVARASR